GVPTGIVNWRRLYQRGDDEAVNAARRLVHEDNDAIVLDQPPKERKLLLSRVRRLAPEPGLIALVFGPFSFRELDHRWRVFQAGFTDHRFHCVGPPLREDRSSPAGSPVAAISAL